MTYYFADRFGWLPDEVERQDEAMMSDLMLFDRQVNYRKWARQNKIDVDDSEDETVIPFGPDVMDYRFAFGVKAI